MKQRMAALLHFLTTPPAWLTRRTAGVLVFSVVFVGMMIWLIPPDRPHVLAATHLQATSIARSQAAAVSPLATPLPSQPTPPFVPPTHTPLPPEYLTNADQTVGIAFFGMILVLIVIIGTAIFIPRGPDE